MGSTLFSILLLVRRREYALQGNDDVYHKVRLHVVVRLAPTDWAYLSRVHRPVPGCSVRSGCRPKIIVQRAHGCRGGVCRRRMGVRRHLTLVHRMGGLASLLTESQSLAGVYRSSST